MECLTHTYKEAQITIDFDPEGVSEAEDAILTTTVKRCVRCGYTPDRLIGGE